MPAKKQAPPILLLLFSSILLVSANLYPADVNSEEQSTPDYVIEINELKNQLPKHLHGKYGFQDIVFGTSFETVKRALNSKFNSLRIMDSTNKYIWLYDFSLGNKKIDVTFLFDHKYRFYAFEFNPGRYSADKFETQVRQDGQFLTELFKKKYGKPAQCFKPGFLSITPGYVTYLCKWKDKDLEIHTHFGVYEFEYYAESFVGSIVLSKEYHKYKKNIDIENVTKGSSNF